MPGRVVRVDRGQCDLVTPLGTLRADTEFVVPRDPLRVVCTGDWAVVDATGNPPYVRALLPRRTAFVRSTSSKRSEGQVLAANVEHALIAVSLAAEVDLGRIERFLSLAWSSGAQPVLVLTKADLVPDETTRSHLLADAATSAPGVPVLAVSAETGEGVDELAAAVAGGTTALLGQSGAGKSTLANALLGRAAQTVRTVRDRDHKGRHTTTTRDLLPLPAERGGGVLIDTPGLRGVGLWDAEDGLRGDRGTGRRLPVRRLRPRRRTRLRGPRRRRERHPARAAPGQLPQAAEGERPAGGTHRRPAARRTAPGGQTAAGPRPPHDGAQARPAPQVLRAQPHGGGAARWGRLLPSPPCRHPRPGAVVARQRHGPASPGCPAARRTWPRPGPDPSSAGPPRAGPPRAGPWRVRNPPAGRHPGPAPHRVARKHDVGRAPRAPALPRQLRSR